MACLCFPCWVLRHPRRRSLSDWTRSSGDVRNSTKKHCAWHRITRSLWATWGSTGISPSTEGITSISSFVLWIGRRSTGWRARTKRRLSERNSSTETTHGHSFDEQKRLSLQPGLGDVILRLVCATLFQLLCRARFRTLRHAKPLLVCFLTCVHQHPVVGDSLEAPPSRALAGRSWQDSCYKIWYSASRCC
jgi:hypothetical protein